MKCKYMIFLCMSGALAGCANSGALMVGPDTYQVNTRVPLTGAAGAQSEALQTANNYCQSIGRNILVQKSHSGECALHGGCGQASVTFYCLVASDPGLKRPPQPTQSELARERDEQIRAEATAEQRRRDAILLTPSQPVIAPTLQFPLMQTSPVNPTVTTDCQQIGNQMHCTSK